MTAPFTPKKIGGIAGALGGGAFRQQLMILSEQKMEEQKAAPPPDAAFEFADKIQRDYLNSRPPTVSVPQARQPGIRLSPEQAQEQQIQSRGNSIAGAVSGGLMDPSLAQLPGALGPAIGGAQLGWKAMGEFGTLSPEESDLAQQEAVDAAKGQQAAMDAQVKMRAEMRNMPTAEFERHGISLPAAAMEPDAYGQGVVDDLALQKSAAEKVAVAEKFAPTQTWWLNASQVASKSAVKMGTGALKAPPIVWEGLRDFYNLDQLTGGGKSTSRAWLDSVDASLDKMLPGDKAQSKDFVTALSAGAGSMLGFMVAGYVGGVAGMPARVTTGALGAASSGTAMFEQAEDFGATGLQKYMAFIMGAGLGLTEAVPIDRMFLRADAATGGLVRRMLANTSKTSLDEFIQEFGQAIGEDMIAKYGAGFDPDRELDVQEWIKQGVIGGIVGGATAGGVELATKAGMSVNPVPVDEQKRLVDEAIDGLQKTIDAAPGMADVQDNDAPEGGMDGGMEIAEAIVAPPGFDAGVLGETVDAADLALPPRAQDAITNFVAVGPRARQGEGAQSGIMDARPLERAVRGEDPELAAEIETAFSPIREQLRSQVGDTIRLYRRQEPINREPGVIRSGFNADGTRSALSWTTDARFADHLAGVRETRPLYTEEQIQAFEREYAETGRAQISKNRWLEQDPLDPTNKYPLIMGPDGMVTDTDSVRAYLEGINEDRQAEAETMNERRQRILVADVALDDVVWVTDRAGQSEFIVRNQPGSSAYVDADGKLAQSGPEAKIGEPTTFRGGTIPTRESDGRLELTHWSRSPRATLDPAAMATGPLRGQERARLKGPDAVPRTYYGVNARLGQSPEELKAMKAELRKAKGHDAEQAIYDKYQKQAGYIREGGLGNIRHTVSVDPDTIYNWNEDPLGLNAQVDRTLPVPEQVTQKERLIKDAGFKGYYMDRSTLGQTVALFDSATPESIVDERTNTPVELQQNAEGFEAKRAPKAPRTLEQEQAELINTIPGLKGVLKYLTPDERARVRKRNAAKLVELFESMPDAKEMAAVAVSGRAKRGWYANSARALVDIFGVQDAPRFTALLAALSPQTSVESNTINALKTWTNWVAAGRPQDAKTIIKIMGQSVEGGGTEASVLDAWKNNSIRALTAPDPTAIVLSGPKVDSFMRNLWGVTNEVTNDAWMANYANIDQSLFARVPGGTDALGTVGVKGHGYMAMSAAVRAAAESASRITGETWTPSEVQETVWSWAKTLFEQAVGGKTAIDILNAGGLTNEAIASTPDFATLFTTGVYRNILEKGGYDVQALASGGRTDGQPGPTGPVSIPEGAKADAEAFERHLRRAARRLDDLRKRRDREAADKEQQRTGKAVTLDEDGLPQSTGEIVDELPFFDDGRPAYDPYDDADIDNQFYAMRSRARPDPGGALPEDFERVTPDLLQRPGWAVVTGTQESMGAFDSPANVENNRRLREELAGTDAIEIKGAYEGVDQGPSWIVFGPRDAALDIAERYGQESVLTHEGLDYGDGTVVRAVPEQTKIGDEARAEPFFSTLPNGQSFSMGLDFETGRVPRVEAARSTPEQGTAANRAVYEAEQTRPEAGIPVTPQNAQEGTDANLAKISKNFINALRLTVRQGRFTLKGSDVMGQYEARQATIRLRTWNDLSSLVHEGGHALNDMMAGPLASFVRANDTELMKIASDLYGGDVNTMPKKQHLREGFAEFFRIYTLNRAFAVREYPTVTDQFQQLLERENPGVEQALLGIGAQFAAYLQAPSVQVLRNQVVSGKQPVGFDAVVAELRDSGFKTWFSEFARNTLAASVNRYAPLNALVTEMLNLGQKNIGKALDVKRAEDPRALARLAPNFGQRAFVQMVDGVMPYNSITPASVSLRDAILVSQGVDPKTTPRKFDEARLADFDAYLVGMRAVDEFRRFADGKIARPPIGMTLGDVEQGLKDLKDKYGDSFDKAAQMVHEFGMAMWDKQYAAGLMDKDTYLENLERQFYVPLQRDMSDKQNELGPGALTGARSLVKRFKGSDRLIISPTTVLMHKLFSLEKAIAENDVKRSLAQLADKAGTAGALVERIPASRMIGTSIGIKEIAKALTKDENITATDAQDLLTLLGGSMDNSISIFRPKEVTEAGENILFFFDGGKLNAIQLKDGSVGADVVNLLNGLGRENLNFGMELIAGTSQIYRTAITAWPDFLIVNFIRDQMSAWVLNNVGFKPFVTGFGGMRDEVRQRQWARSYNASMGIMGGMNVAALHRSRMERDIGSLRSKGYFHKAFGDPGFMGAVAGVGRLMELSETGTRVGLYKKAFERGKADGLNDWEASLEAAYLATDYIDFGLNGNRMLMARRTIPFLNAQIQGFYKMLRVLGADEVRQRKGLKFVLGAYLKSTKGMDLSRLEKQALNTGRLAWIKMVSLGLLSALLHFAFEDDEDYQEVGEYMRVTNWVIPIGDGRIISIPKPFELAMIANAVERGLEMASGDTAAKDKFLRGAALSLMPPLGPPAVQSAIELGANYDFFSGQQIVPDYQRALDPALQYNSYTSSLAKELGAAIGVSPLKLEHILGGLGASAYRDMTTMLNAADPNRPSLDATDAPIARRFVRDARRGSQTSADFWAQASTLNGKLRTAEVSYKAFLEQGNEPAANRFLAGLSSDEQAYALLAVNFKADAKRLNPFYRGRQISTIVSAMRREMVSELGLEDTDKFTDTGKIPLTAKVKAQVDETLSEIARREMRNTLVATGAPGWVGKKPMPVEPTIALLEEIAPRAAEEYRRRIEKAKVYDGQYVFDTWPEVRDRLLQDREEAYLDDLVTTAEALR